VSGGDFDFEPVKGLPQVLPVDERMLWQGSPRWQDLAVHAFHARKVIWYFVAIAAIQGAFRLADGVPLAEAMMPFTWLIPMGLVAAAILTGLAYASARTTVYTMTSKRIVMRIGIALPITLNLPFKLIDGASVRLYGNGSGEIPLKLHGKERVAYMVLWPHARPLHFSKPEPALRAIPDADRVASLLASALTGTATLTTTAAASTARINPEAVAA
jgi:hypothetical protein